MQDRTTQIIIFYFKLKLKISLNSHKNQFLCVVCVFVYCLMYICVMNTSECVGVPASMHAFGGHV